MGEIVAVEADGFTVVCADGRFKVARVQPPTARRSSGEWANLPPIAQSSDPGMSVFTPIRPLAAAAKAHTPASQHAKPKSDIEIAQAAKMRPHPRYRARKARHRAGEPRALWPLQGQGLDRLHQVAADRPNGKLILVRRSRRRRQARARPRPRSASPTRSTTSARRRCCACASPRSAPASA